MDLLNGLFEILIWSVFVSMAYKLSITESKEGHTLDEVNRPKATNGMTEPNKPIRVTYLHKYKGFQRRMYKDIYL